MKWQTLTQTLAVLSLVAFCFPSCKTDTSAGCPPVEFSTENTVNIRMLGAAVSFNPHNAKSGYDGFVSSQIIQTLGNVEPKTLEMIPVMIKKIPAARKEQKGPYAGMLAYDFELYDDARWDNGSPVTVNDVIFSLKIIFHPLLPLAGRYAGYFEHLKGVESDPANPKKFTVYFSKYYILALESLCQFPIYPAYNYDPEGLLAAIPLSDFLNREKMAQQAESNPALKRWADFFLSPQFSTDKTAISGSGPYRLESLDVDQGCVLVKKENWWGDKHVSENPYTAAFPQKLVYRYMKDDVPAESLIRSDGLDVIPDLAPGRFVALQKDSCLATRYDFITQTTSSVGRIMINHNNPALADKRVRQALACAIDYNYLINTVYQGMAERIVGIVHPAKPFYARSIKPYNYDIQKAKALLAAAGWTDSNGDGIADKMVNGVRTDLKLQMLAAGSAITQESAKNIASTARNAGFEITLVETDITAYRGLTSKGQYDLALSAVALYPGLVEFYQVYHTKSIGADNKFNYSNPETDALIEAIRTEPNDAKRNELYIRAQEKFYEDLPEIYLYVPKQRIILSKRFNYVLTPNRPGYYEQYFRLIQ